MIMEEKQTGLEIKVIAICGKSNVGKTTSILVSADLIIDSLRKKYKDVVVYGPNSYGKRKSKDKWYVISVGEKRVAILSRGDNKWEIESGLDYVKECDFYICAAHLSGDTVGCLVDKFGIDKTLFINKIGLLNRSIREFDSDYKQSKNEIVAKNNMFANLIADLFFKYFRME